MTRMMKTILTVSVLLNVLLLGALGGYSFNAFQHRPERSKAMHEGLSPEGQRLLDESFQQARTKMKGQFKAARHLRHGMMDIMTAEEFDAAAFDKLAAEMLAMHTAMMQAKMEAHKALAVELPASDRQLLAKKLSSLGGPDEPRHRKDGFRKFSGPNKEDAPLRTMENTSP